MHVPDQIARGTTLRVLVSDADWLNRASRGFTFAGAGRRAGRARPVIALLNRERRNDRCMWGLFVPAPTLVWDDKEMPNVPLSQINVVDGRPAPGSVQVLRESLASESSIPLGGPVSGVILFEFADPVNPILCLQTMRGKQHRQAFLFSCAPNVSRRGARESFAGAVFSAAAEHTRRWRQSTYDEFLKGTAQGWRCAATGSWNWRRNLRCWRMRTLRICGRCDRTRTGVCTRRAVRRQKFFALMDRANPTTVFRVDGSGWRKPSRLTRRARCIVATSPDGKVYQVSAVRGEKRFL